MTETQGKKLERRPQERSEITKRKLIKVALEEFSARGFDAVTVRDIEVRAGVQRNLVNYHFGSKKELWKASAGYNIERLNKFAIRRRELMRDMSSTRERVAYIVKSFVRFCANHPQFNRMLIEEGTQESWRIQWLVDNYVKRMMINTRALVQSDLGLTEEEFVSWYYLLVGGGAMISSLAPEAKLLFGVDTTSDRIINRHADMMSKLLTMNMPNLSES